MRTRQAMRLRHRCADQPAGRNVAALPLGVDVLATTAVVRRLEGSTVGASAVPEPTGDVRAYDDQPTAVVPVGAGDGLAVRCTCSPACWLLPAEVVEELVVDALTTTGRRRAAIVPTGDARVRTFPNLDVLRAYLGATAAA